MKQFVTISMDHELVELRFSGVKGSLIIRPERLKKIILKKVGKEFKKLNKKVKRHKDGSD